MDQLNYYYGQGRISLATIDATTGAPGKYRFVGDVSACSVKLTSDKVTHNEAFSGRVSQTVSFPVKQAGTIDMTINQVDPDNLALALFGAVLSTQAGTVTAETVGGDLEEGDVFYLANPQVSDVALTDSTAQPVSLVEGTHYSIDDASFGRLILLSAEGITLPIKAAYSYGAVQQAGIFAAKQPVVALRYEGYNLADGNKPVMVDLYKVATDPLAELALISTGNDVAGMEITGGLLADSTKPVNAALGQFGVIKQIALPAATP